MRRQTPATVCVPTQPVAAAPGGVPSAMAVLVAPVPVLRHGCCTAAHALCDRPPHAHKTLSHRTSLPYVLHCWYSAYSRSAPGASAARARVLRWQPYRRCGLSAPATAAWYPSRKPPSYPSSPGKPTASHRVAPARHTQRSSVRLCASRLHVGFASPPRPAARARSTRPEAGHTTTYDLHHHPCQR